MRLVHQSRDYFCFALEKDDPKINGYGIKTKDDFIWFPRNPIRSDISFVSPSQCVDWIKKGFTMKKGFRANEKTYKTLFDVKTTSIKEITSETFSKIQSLMTDKEQISKEDIVTFSSYLANNFVDRDAERFSLPVLKDFNKTIIGKSKLIGHAKPAPGIGIYYSSKLIKMDVKETLDFVGPHPNKKFEDHLKEIVDIDGAIYWLNPEFYMLMDNMEFVRKIFAGIVKHESIGFRCPKLVPVKADDNDSESSIKWWEYQNSGEYGSEALEGSYVWLGAQYGASNVRKTSKDGLPDLKSEAIDLDEKRIFILNPISQYDEFETVENNDNEKPFTVVYGKTEDGQEPCYIEAESKDWDLAEFAELVKLQMDKLFKETNINEGVKSMRIALKSVDYDQDVDLSKESEVTKALLDIDKKYEKAISEIPVLEDSDKDMIDYINTTFKGVIDDGKSVPDHINEIIKMSAYGIKAQEKQIDSIVALKAALGLIKNEESIVEEEKKMLSALSPEQLDAMHTQFHEKWKADNPAGQLPENLDDLSENEDGQQTKQKDGKTKLRFNPSHVASV